ncbi:MAG: RidA family protein [bacterium]|nr:RidA family protein [bacterium]
MTAHRRHIASGSIWEERVGYSRAVRVGNHVHVAGTTSDGPDAYVQAKGAIAKIEQALEEAGASLDDVVRTRLFVTDIADWELVGRAHAEAFADVRPVTTMVEVSRLIAPDLYVEIEADAYIDR